MRFAGHILGAAAGLILTAAMAATSFGAARAAEQGVATFAPVAQARPSPKRLAILIVSQPIGSNPRAGIAHADENVYRGRLRELGFEVITIGPGIRPVMDRQLRDATTRIPNDGEAALFVLGSALSANGDVFIQPSDALPGLSARPELLATEGVSVEGVVRRAMARGPRNFVAIIDECANVEAANAPCPMDLLNATGGSVVVTYRRPMNASAQPVAALPSVQRSLLPLMTEEGLTFLQLYGRLRTALNGTPLAIAASSSLSQDFAFLPTNYFAQAQTACNQIMPDADLETVRRTNYDPPLSACQQALAIWPYATRFEQLRNAGLEQSSVKRAIASCTDRPAAASYNAAYPSGRYRAIVQQFIADCDRAVTPAPLPPLPAPAPAPSASLDLCRNALNQPRNGWDTGPGYARDVQEAQRRGLSVQDCIRITEPASAPPPPSGRATLMSRAGWGSSFNSSDFYIDPEANDTYDPRRETFVTVLKSRREIGGEPAVLFVQVSLNARCVRPSTYANETLARTRLRRTVFEDRSNATWFNIYLESDGFRIGNSQKDFVVLDLLATRRSDESSLFHVGGRGPKELMGMLRTEYNEILRNMRWPSAGPLVNRC